MIRIAVGSQMILIMISVILDDIVLNISLSSPPEESVVKVFGGAIVSVHLVGISVDNALDSAPLEELEFGALYSAIMDYYSQLSITICTPSYGELKGMQ